MENDVIYNEPDPMNPLCDVWTFKGADRWYFTREEAEKAYNELIHFDPKPTDLWHAKKQ